MNIVIQLGRLTKDPQIGTSQAGVKYATFSIAVDRRYSGGDGAEKKADFHNCVAFNRKNGSQNADFVEKHLKKGKPIIVRGELQNRQWTTQGGEKRTTTEIIVDSIEFLPLSGNGNGGGNQVPASEPEAASETAPEAEPAATAATDGDPWAVI